MKKSVMFICLALALCIALSSASYAAESRNGCSKSFWQKLFSYPANMTKESASVVAETGKMGANVVVNEMTAAGSVVSGNTDKAKDLVVEPVKGTAEMAGKAVEGSLKAPYAAATAEAKPVEEAAKDAAMETAKIVSETAAGAVTDTATSTATTAKQAITAPVKAMGTK